MSIQPHIFEPGKRYTVPQSFTVGPSSFEADEILVFELDGYVPYDGSYAYQFRNQRSGHIKTWLLHESSPLDMWRSLFHQLE